MLFHDRFSGIVVFFCIIRHATRFVFGNVGRGNKHQPGIQEVKEWKAVIAYLQSFADTDGDGLPEIPERYRGPLGRHIVAASWNPYHLLKGGSMVTWLAFGALLLGLVIVVGASWFIVRKTRRR